MRIVRASKWDSVFQYLSRDDDAFPHLEDVFHRMRNHCRPDDAKGNKKILDKRYQTDSETAYSIASKVGYIPMLVNGKSEQINIGH